MKPTRYLKAAALSFVMLFVSISNANAISLTFIDPNFDPLNDPDTNPSTASIFVGETVTMDLWFTGVPVDRPLDGGDITFTYDMSGAVSVATVDPVVMNSANPYGIGFASDPSGGTNNTTTNTVNFDFALPLVGSTATGLTGDIKLASVTFTGEQAGTASLLFTAATFLYDSAFNDYAITLDTAAINVTVAAVPLPAAVWMLGSGLLGLMGFGRLRRKTTAQTAVAA